MHTRNVTIVAVLVFLITVLAVPRAGASARIQIDAEDNPCRFPDAIAASGKHTEAAAQYLALLADDPGLECAEEGYIAAISANQPDAFATVRALMSRGEIQAAREELGRVLEENPQVAVPEEFATLLESPFAEATALYTSGLVLQARDALETVIEAHPTADVPAELSWMVEPPFNTVLDFLKEGEFDKAQNAFNEALAQNPAATVPDQLTALLQGPFAVARALDNAGLVAEARAAFITAVEANPSVTVPDDLGHLDGRASHDCKWSLSRTCLHELENWIEESLKWVLPLLGYLAAVVLIAFALLRFCFNRLSLRVDITPFETSSSGSSIGSTIAEATQAIYGQMNEAHLGGSPKVIADAKAEKETNIPSVLPGDASNLIQSFINWVWHLGNKPYSFGGTTIADPARGAGIVLSLQRDNKITKSQTIWYREVFDPSKREETSTAPESLQYIAMAEMAAIQLYAWLPKNSWNSFSGRSKMEHLYHSEWRDAESFGLFRNAITMVRREKEQSAIDLLQDSLSLDPFFLPARMNLATLTFQETLKGSSLNSSDRERAIKEYYSELRTLWLKSPEQSNDETLRPRVLFNYLASADYLAGWPDPKVLKDVNDELIALDEYVVSTNDKLKAIKPSLERMQDTITIWSDDEDKRDKVLNKYKVRLSGSNDDFGVRAWYGNACFCAAAFHAVQYATDKKFWGEKTLQQLEYAVDRDHKLRRWAKVDPSLEPLRVSPLYGKQFGAIVAPPKKAASPSPHALAAIVEPPNVASSSPRNALASIIECIWDRIKTALRS